MSKCCFSREVLKIIRKFENLYANSIGKDNVRMSFNARNNNKKLFIVNRKKLLMGLNKEIIFAQTHIHAQRHTQFTLICL
jgi:hypothetical protein